ncbi:hypothetical protein X975_24082, partial [Stegodyphus mimosarum]
MAACSRVMCLTNRSRTYLYNKSTKLYSSTATVKSTSGE